jgi:outer membrane protein OmpA-like peptidoglycan-associated protein
MKSPIGTGHCGLNESFFEFTIKISGFFLLTAIFFIPEYLSSQTTQTCDINDKGQLEYIVSIYTPLEDAFVAIQRLAKPYIDRRDWKDGAKVYEMYKSKFPDMKERFDKIIALLLAPEVGIFPVNLGGGINTRSPEYVPILTPDMKKLYFTGRDREDGFGGEDIFVSEFKNNMWQLARPLGQKINTESNEFINSISADGNILVLFGNYEGTLGRGDNFYVEKTAKGWSDIKQYPQPINSTYWDADAFLTADGKAIIFSSERPGGIGDYHQKGDCFHDMYWGNTDIYVCLKKDDGTWSEKAINLGPVINTPYTDRSPSLHPDGKTLYFSSDGHYGIGKSDVFRSVRLSDTSWTMWSEPVNLGKEINTTGEDWGYKISTDGKRAYFSTVKAGGFGREDIYYINLPQEVQPVREVFTINGKVLDENGNPVDATLKWEDVQLNKEVGTAKTDPETGQYFIALPVGKYYAYYAEAKGYYSDVYYMDLTEKKDFQEINTDVNIVSIEELKESGKSIRIEHIFFDFNKYELKEESYNSLNRLVKFLSANLAIGVEINAYTDNIGSENYNLTLSDRRASSVVNYLISKGIAQSRMLPRGYGKQNPIASNDTEEGRAMNRRVEFRILKTP